MVLIGANAAGLVNKVDSLLRLVSVFKPGVIFIQESKVRRKNGISLTDYDCLSQLGRNLAVGVC